VPRDKEIPHSFGTRSPFRPATAERMRRQLMKPTARDARDAIFYVSKRLIRQRMCNLYERQ